MESYKKCTEWKCSFLVDEMTSTPNNLSRFRNKILEKTFWNRYIIKSGKFMIWLKVESANIILIEKLQNMVSSVSSALSSGKFDKYEKLKKYLTVEEILLSNHKKIIKQAKFIYFFEKSFWKTNKNNSTSRRRIC